MKTGMDGQKLGRSMSEWVGFFVPRCVCVYVRRKKKKKTSHQPQRRGKKKSWLKCRCEKWVDISPVVRAFFVSFGVWRLDIPLWGSGVVGPKDS